MLLPINKWNKCTLSENTCKFFTMYLDMPKHIPHVPDVYVFEQDGAPSYFWKPLINSSFRNLKECSLVEVTSQILDLTLMTYSYMNTSRVSWIRPQSTTSFLIFTAESSML
jgi:hypothetical protein